MTDIKEDVSDRNAKKTWSLPKDFFDENKPDSSLPSAGEFSFFKIADKELYKKRFNLFKEFYDDLEEACRNSIETFWKNRVTLIKFGKKYCTNFFCNLSLLNKTIPIESYFNSIEKPILLFGAGESIDIFFDTEENLKRNFKIASKKTSNETSDKTSKMLAEKLRSYFIICADTALQPLLQRNIKVDAVFIEEAQSVILKAFIGCKNEDFHIFASLSSVRQLGNLFPSERISFFCTKFAELNFFENLREKNCLPFENEPFGSVGITAVFYALKFRKNEQIPIFICGLDFSFAEGKTHAKGTLAVNECLKQTNRVTSINNYRPAYSYGNSKKYDKNGDIVISSPTLLSYAKTFRQLFSKEKELYDCAAIGLDLELPKGEWKKAKQKSSSSEKNSCTKTSTSKPTSEVYTSEKPLSEKSTSEKKYSENNTKKNYMEIQKILQSEKSELLQLKRLLTEKTSLNEEELKEKITLLAKKKNYLYLHFPDGYSFSYNQSFLNRLRIQLDFFLKLL